MLPFVAQLSTSCCCKKQAVWMIRICSVICMLAPFVRAGVFFLFLFPFPFLYYYFIFLFFFLIFCPNAVRILRLLQIDKFNRHSLTPYTHSSLTVLRFGD